MGRGGEVVVGLPCSVLAYRHRMVLGMSSAGDDDENDKDSTRTRGTHATSTSN